MAEIRLIVRGALLHDRQFLLTEVNDGVRERFHCFIGGALAFGEPMLNCLERHFSEEFGLDVLPSKLLYITENFYSRGGEGIHEVGYYFLCHLRKITDQPLAKILRPNVSHVVTPVILRPEEIAGVNFQPAQLTGFITADALDHFAGHVRVITINELPAQVVMPGGEQQFDER